MAFFVRLKQKNTENTKNKWITKLLFIFFLCVLCVMICQKKVLCVSPVLSKQPTIVSFFESGMTTIFIWPTFLGF